MFRGGRRVVENFIGEISSKAPIFLPSCESYFVLFRLQSVQFFFSASLPYLANEHVFSLASIFFGSTSGSRLSNFPGQFELLCRSFKKFLCGRRKWSQFELLVLFCCAGKSLKLPTTKATPINCCSVARSAQNKIQLRVRTTY
jgi:hypothetical protein